MNLITASAVSMKEKEKNKFLDKIEDLQEG